VADLVSEHGLELVALEQLEQAGRDADGRVLGRAPHGKRVRRRDVRHGHARHRHVGLDREPLDQRMQPGGVLSGHHPGMHGPQCQTLGQPELPERHGGEEDDHHDQAAARSDDHTAEDDVEQGEEREGYEHPRLQPWVPADQVAWASHATEARLQEASRPWAEPPISHE
jgi:hypothetical protein